MITLEHNHPITIFFLFFVLRFLYLPGRCLCTCSMKRSCCCIWAGSCPATPRNCPSLFSASECLFFSKHFPLVNITFLFALDTFFLVVRTFFAAFFNFFYQNLFLCHLIVSILTIFLWITPHIHLICTIQQIQIHSLIWIQFPTLFFPVIEQIQVKFST